MLVLVFIFPHVEIKWGLSWFIFNIAVSLTNFHVKIFRYKQKNKNVFPGARNRLLSISNEIKEKRKRQHEAYVERRCMCMQPVRREVFDGSSSE